jgi:hypothetical protein
MKFKFTILLSFLWFAVVANPTVPTGEFTKSIQKEFDISANGMVHLTNKYGKVEVHSWNQNLVQINITITVDAGSENKANDVFEKINIEFEDSEDQVKVWTNIESTSGSKWSWFKSNSAKYTIDYEVKAPASNELFVQNKYGNIYIGNFKNEVEVDLKYGDLTVGEIDSDVSANIKYGNAQFQDLGNLELNCGYADIKGMDAGDLQVDSKYSQISFDKVGDVIVNSKYDEFTFAEVGDIQNSGKYDSFVLGKARTVNLESKYTNITVEELLKNAHIDLDYGGVKLKNISPACTDLELQGKHTGVKLYIGGNYNLELNTKYTGVNLPSNFTSETHDKDGNELYIRGYSGSKSADTKISVEMKYGSFTIK